MDDSLPSDETKLQPSFALARAKPCGAARLDWTDATGPHSVVLQQLALLGSAPKASIVIADPTVSRIHAELEIRESDVWIRDLGSRNGTFVDGVRVGSAQVPDGGKICLGGTFLHLKYAPADEPQQLWPEPKFGPLIGTSLVMRRMFAYLNLIASAESPVLIRGETGTGKELVAQAIHGASRRARGPFVIVDCAALPDQLIEADLFGHAKGAFTGAIAARIGALEAADGGTVFLDEIGELPLSLQPRLLRVLESGTIRRVGETIQRRIDVRFLSATHRDLQTMVNVGAFREDLFFRLAVFPVEVPALRHRPEDVELLVRHFLPTETSVPAPDVVQWLTKQPWLGNVRELRNFAHRAIAIGTREAMSMTLPPPAAPPRPASVRPPAPPSPSAADMVGDDVFTSDFRTFRDQWIDVGEREYVRRLLATHGRKVTNAAQQAGLTRTYLHRLIRKHLL